MNRKSRRRYFRGKKIKRVPICRVCNKPIAVGDWIIRHKSSVYIHKQCFPIFRVDSGPSEETDQEVEAFFNIVT
jgi:hypothetical protein